MATIKSHTSLSQNKTLSKILRHETADMFYVAGKGEPIFIGNKMVACGNDDYDALGVPDVLCWSLAALLGVLPKDKSIDCAISFGYYNGKGEYIEKWVCSFEKEGETTDDFIIETTDGDNPIDACVAMIEKLHELKML